MSSYNPPTENVAIFDSAYFSAGDENITQNDADKRYLRYPNAQGTENLQAINVSGLATFTNQIISSKPHVAGFPPISVSPTGNSGSDTVGIRMTNCNITQTGTYIGVNINQLGATKILPGCTLQFDKQAQQVYDSSITGQQYYLSSFNTPNFKFSTYVSGSQNTMIDISSNSLITFPPPLYNTSTMPSSSDSSTRMPTTAWVQSAITAGSGTNLTKNSYIVSPTSNALMYTSGINDIYNTGGYYSYTSTSSVNFAGIGWVTNNPLRVYIQIANGISPYNPVNPFIPTFSPLLKPIKIKLNCFVYNTSGSTAYTSCTLLLLPSCMFGDSIGNGFWGRTGSNTGNLAYNLDNKINGNGAFIINDTYCPWPASVTGTANVTPNNTGRQYYSYEYSSSTNMTVLGSTEFAGGKFSINIWFGGIGSTGTSTDNTYLINARIEDATGATSSPSLCGVYLAS